MRLVEIKYLLPSNLVEYIEDYKELLEEIQESIYSDYFQDNKRVTGISNWMYLHKKVKDKFQDYVFKIKCMSSPTQIYKYIKKLEENEIREDIKIKLNNNLCIIL